MADPRSTLEREIKLDVDAGFVLPDLPGEPLAVRTFTSAYVDTEDRRLLGLGITLRRRTEGRSCLWQLKLPQAEDRLELEAPGLDEVPAELGDLLVAVLRGRPLVTVARLRTRRTGVLATAPNGAVAEVVVDSVAAIENGDVSRRLTEVEVELVAGDPAGLKQLAGVLTAAGARPSDGRPKLEQVLGSPPRASEPAPSAPAAVHVRQALREQARALLRHDPGTRLGQDPEELHQHRVATRRLRAVLRAARPLLDVSWSEPLRAEIGWLGAALGPVRDLDVMLEYLESEEETLDAADRAGLAPMIERLHADRDRARASLIAALTSQRYLDLLDAVEAGAESPRIVVSEVTLHAIAARQFRRLRRRVRALNADPPDDELHAVRIAGKRARYAAELAERSVGKPAARFVTATKALQDVIGLHQDAAVAEETVRALLGTVAGADGLIAAGRIVERQRARKAAARRDWPAAWRAVDRSGRDVWT